MLLLDYAWDVLRLGLQEVGDIDPLLSSCQRAQQCPSHAYLRTNVHSNNQNKELQCIVRTSFLHPYTNQQPAKLRNS
jgi:hypothetical protein